MAKSGWRRKTAPGMAPMEEKDGRGVGKGVDCGTDSTEELRIEECWKAGRRRWRSPTSSVVPKQFPIAVKFSMHLKFTGSPVTFIHASLSNSSISSAPSFSTLNHLRHVVSFSRNVLAVSGSSINRNN
ncbi:hypothetical protein LXL04_003587 [Taraxacum kok-saghyz]